MKFVTNAFGSRDGAKARKKTRKGTKARKNKSPTSQAPANASDELAARPEEPEEDEFVSLADLEDAVIESKGTNGKGNTDKIEVREEIEETPEPAPRQGQPQARRAPKMGPDREALLRQALQVQRHKQEIFEDLDEEHREKLYLMAMKTLVDPNFGEKKGAKKKKK